MWSEGWGSKVCVKLKNMLRRIRTLSCILKQAEFSGDLKNIVPRTISVFSQRNADIIRGHLLMISTESGTMFPMYTFL